MFLEDLKSRIKSVPVLARIYHPIVRASHRYYNRRERNLAYARRTIATIAKRCSMPVFVKVGANDGISGDPLSDLLLTDTRWRGVLIEPVPYCFERLKSNFGDSSRFTLEQIAIGPAATASFYYVAQNAIQDIPDLSFYYDQVGSFDKNHILKHFDGVLAPYIVECKVEVRTLDEVLARNGIREFHLLQIDAESFDLEVLKTLDLAARGPLSIFVEHMHLGDSEKQEMVRLLERHGYTVRDCGFDYFALRRAWRSKAT